jgi:hypothetical protein
MKEIVLEITNRRFDSSDMDIEKKIHKEKNQVSNKKNYSNMSKYLSKKSKVK